MSSDTAPLNGLVADLLAAAPGLRALRDATRGGVATILNEIATAAGVGVLVAEDDIPVRPEVRGASELLGIDPMYVACEGRLVAVVSPQDADRALAAMRAHPQGQPRRPSSARSRPSRPASSSSRRRSAAPGSSTCWSAIRCRGSADRANRSQSGTGRDSARAGHHRGPGRRRDASGCQASGSRASGWRSAPCPAWSPTPSGSASTW